MKRLFTLFFILIPTLGISQSIDLHIQVSRKNGLTEIILDSIGKDAFELNPQCSMDLGLQLKRNLADGFYKVFINDTLAYTAYYNNKVRDGIWSYYRADGSLSYSEFYKNGELVQEKR